jgi:hypothetical protein
VLGRMGCRNIVVPIVGPGTETERKLFSKTVVHANMIVECTEHYNMYPRTLLYRFWNAKSFRRHNCNCPVDECNSRDSHPQLSKCEYVLYCRNGI